MVVGERFRGWNDDDDDDLVVVRKEEWVGESVSGGARNRKGR